MPPAGTRTRNPNTPAAADPGVRARGYWDRPGTVLTHKKYGQGWEVKRNYLLIKQITQCNQIVVSDCSPLSIVCITMQHQVSNMPERSTRIQRWFPLKITNKRMLWRRSVMWDTRSLSDGLCGSIPVQFAGYWLVRQGTGTNRVRRNWLTE